MKRILSIALILLMVLWLSACKKTVGSSSDIESDLLTSTNQSISETENSKDEPKASEEESSETNGESEKSQTNTVTNNSSSSSSLQSTEENSVPQTPTESDETPIQNEDSSNDTPVKNDTVSARQKMTGSWTFMIPENTITSDEWRDPGFRFVYDLTILDSGEIWLSEKEYIRSDTLTIGEIKYFDGQRYTLANDSATQGGGSYSGQFVTTAADGNVAIIKIDDYETQRGLYLIEETHYLTLIDDTHLQWNKCEVYSEFIKEKFFPWDTSTVFAKK